MIIDTVRSQNVCEVFAPVVFKPNTDSSATFAVQGKVDTGAMVSCMPVSMVPQIGLSSNDLTPNRSIIPGMSGTDLQNCGTVDINVMCNNITTKARFYVTKHDYALILGLEFCKIFKLVTISPVCVQQHTISVEPNKVEAVHITKESEVDYSKLKTKWMEHILLGKKTGSPLQDLKDIFPDTFDGQVGLFEGEAHLKVSPEAQPVQLPPRAVPQSVMPALKKELDKSEKELSDPAQRLQSGCTILWLS